MGTKPDTKKTDLEEIYQKIKKAPAEKTKYDLLTEKIDNILEQKEARKKEREERAARKKEEQKKRLMEEEREYLKNLELKFEKKMAAVAESKKKSKEVNESK